MLYAFAESATTQQEGVDENTINGTKNYHANEAIVAKPVSQVYDETLRVLSLTEAVNLALGTSPGRKVKLVGSLG